MIIWPIDGVREAVTEFCEKNLVVGVAYCLVSWSIGLPKHAPIDKELLLLLTLVAICHVMTNVLFAIVAVSFAHTIKSSGAFLQRFCLSVYSWTIDHFHSKVTCYMEDETCECQKLMSF